MTQRAPGARSVRNSTDEQDRRVAEVDAAMAEYTSIVDAAAEAAGALRKLLARCEAFESAQRRSTVSREVGLGRTLNIHATTSAVGGAVSSMSRIVSSRRRLEVASESLRDAARESA